MIRFIASLIITGTLCSACSSLSKSESTLRSNYLAITQPGINMDEAIVLIKKKIKPEGSLIVRENTPCLNREATARQIGTHSVRVNLGWYYWGTVETPVYGEWCFNEDRQLMDIIVRKNIDDAATEHSGHGVPPENR